MYREANRVLFHSSSLYTLLKPKRHSLRCHDFMVHALLLRMRTNVVYFRVMRRLCRREWNWLWNWQCVNLHPWQRTRDRDHGVWRLTLTSDFNSVLTRPVLGKLINVLRRCCDVYGPIIQVLLTVSWSGQGQIHKSNPSHGFSPRH